MKIKPEAHFIGSVKLVLAAVVLSFLLWVTVGRADDRVTAIDSTGLITILLAWS